MFRNYPRFSQWHVHEKVLFFFFFFLLIHVSVTGEYWVIIKYKPLDEVSVSCSVALLESTLAKTFVFIYADPSEIC